uniref:Uncharacterized protein n=1 Tax=Knipowitschia caucasica TaxID=637954 RepID=A0AAV2IWG3_KNICA
MSEHGLSNPATPRHRPGEISPPLAPRQETPQLQSRHLRTVIPLSESDLVVCLVSLQNESCSGHFSSNNPLFPSRAAKPFDQSERHASQTASERPGEGFGASAEVSGLTAHFWNKLRRCMRAILVAAGRKASPADPITALQLFPSAKPYQPGPSEEQGINYTWRVSV